MKAKLFFLLFTLQAFAHPGLNLRSPALLGSLRPPVDAVEVDFAVMGTGSGTVNAASLNAGNVGNTTGWVTWQLSRDPLEHTFVRSASMVRRTPYDIGGLIYDGTGYKTIELDLDLATSNGSTPFWEAHQLNPPADTFHDGITVSQLVILEGTWPGTDASYDYCLTYTGGGKYGSMQYNVQSDHQFLRTEGAQAGFTKRGRNIDITGYFGAQLSTTLRMNEPEQRTELCVVDNVTGEFVGSSEAGTDVETLTAILRQSYLGPGGGKITLGPMGVDYTHRSFPLEAFTVPPPTSLVAVQTGIDEITLTCTHRTQRLLIERQVNGGAWATLESNWSVTDVAPPLYTTTTGYIDSSVSDGNTYAYRARALVGSQQSALSSASNTETVDNEAFPSITDDFDALPNASSLGAPNWHDEALGTTVRNPSGDGAVYGNGAGISLTRRTETVTANQRVEFTLDAVTAGGGFDLAGGAVRIQSGAATGYMVCASAGDLYLFEVVGGTAATIMSDTAMTLIAGDRIALEVTGTGAATRLTVQLNDGSGWVNWWTSINPPTDIDGGYPGIGSWIFGGPNNRIDDFKFYALP
jgi:hypothetical protein